MVSHVRRAASGIVLGVSQNNFNLQAYLASRGQLAAKPYTVVIKPGVTIGSTSTATPAFDTGTLPPGATLKIINRGRIQGKGGDGGLSGWGGVFPRAGAAGQAGGDALKLGLNVTIYNFGRIYGGGGGGGGGGSAGSSSGTPTEGSGGGGGGSGTIGGSGGAGSGGTFGNVNFGQNGQPGTSDAGGLGGLEGGGGGQDAGDGGNGGGPGQAGENGTPGNGGSGGSGGAAGKAINLNGFGATFVVGNNSDQIRGTVS